VCRSVVQIKARDYFTERRTSADAVSRRVVPPSANSNIRSIIKDISSDN